MAAALHQSIERDAYVAHPDPRIVELFQAALLPLRADPLGHTRKQLYQRHDASSEATTAVDRRPVVDALFGAEHTEDGLGVPMDGFVSVELLRSRATYITGRAMSPRSWRRFVCCLQGAVPTALLGQQHLQGSKQSDNDEWMDDVEVTNDTLTWLAACSRTRRQHGAGGDHNSVLLSASPKATAGRHFMGSPSMSPNHRPAGSPTRLALPSNNPDGPIDAVERELEIDEPETVASTMDVCGVTVPVWQKRDAAAGGAVGVAIHKADVRAAFQRLGYGPSVLDNETFDILFAGADADGDGALTPDEFALLLTSFGEDGDS